MSEPTIPCECGHAIADHAECGCMAMEEEIDGVAVFCGCLASRPSAPVPSPASEPREPNVARLDALGLTGDFLGERVREAWVRWAETQPNPKPHWLAPWSELGEADREADRQIGRAIALWTLLYASAAASPASTHGIGGLLDDYRLALLRAWAVQDLTAEHVEEASRNLAAARAAVDRALALVEREREEARAVPQATCRSCQRDGYWHSMYRCFQCQGWFHEACMADHLARTHNTGGDRAESVRATTGPEGDRNG
jgi:hypothetical protein